MTMDFFLPKHLHEPLRVKLSGVPDLVEELAITITRQSRIQKRGLSKPSRPKPESRVPFHIAAAEAADELQTCLATWVRMVCEERRIRYTDRDDAITLSRWLRKNVVALALTQGSEEAHDDIVYRIEHCRSLIDLPPDDDVVIDPVRVSQANRQVLTADQVDKIAPRLGALAEGLNKRRVETLAKSGRLKVDSRDGDTCFFRLGDVLDAHHRHARRNRKKAS